MTEVSSRHLRNTSELLVMAPIKQGFVPLADRTMSYATRLRVFLSGLYDLRRVAAEQELAWMVGPIEKLRTIWNSQWTVLPDDRHLLVTVAFDRSWEEYFQLLVEHSGASLDLIFSHCEGYAERTCVEPERRTLRYQGFSDYVRRHQVRSDFYYVANPDLTSDDVAYLRKLAAQPQPSAQAAAELTLGDVEEELAKRQYDYAYPAALVAASKVPGLTPDEREAQAKAFVKKALQKGAQHMTVRALAAFQGLRELFPKCPEGTGLRPARELFDDGVYNLLPSVATLERDALPAALAKWVAELQKLGAPGKPVPETVALDEAALRDIQGNLLAYYEHMTHGCSVLLRCADAAAGRAFLAKMAERVTWHAQQAQQPRVSFADSVAKVGPRFGNLAVTFAGLRKLGLSEATLGVLPREFREGMEKRAGALGDVGYPNHPANWQLPAANYRGVDQPLADEADAPRVRLESVDFVVSYEVAGPQKHYDWGVHPLRAAVEELEGDGTEILHVQVLQRSFTPNGDALEHFGFVDGTSQPIPDAILDGAQPVGPLRDRVALGEILLGYADNRNELAWCADPDHAGPAAALFKNGSFLVVRKLAQDVAAFNEFAERNAAATGHEPDQVKEWTLGRTLDGNAPLVAPRVAGNDFGYQDDMAGRACPFHAHIRRANPRTLDEHGRGISPRIVRRGFSYGPRYETAPGAERGLMFMAYNASIASQYEVIQRWINGGNSVGILSAQNDLFSGNPQPAEAPHWVYGQDGQWRSLSPAPKPFVRVCWGLYAFVPSRAAMLGIARLPLPEPPRDGDPRVAQGRKIIAALSAVDARVDLAVDDDVRKDALQAAVDGWKSIIEDPVNAGRAALLWAAIRAGRGVLPTRYGVLVASERAAREVLRGDGRTFSVREYWHRLNAATGEHYISFDPHPCPLHEGDAERDARHEQYQARLLDVDERGYAALGVPADDVIEREFGEDGAYGPDNTFAMACAHAEGVLNGLAAARVSKAAPVELDLRKLALPVVAMLCRQWFGIPVVAQDAADGMQALVDGIMPFVRASQYSFQPYPLSVLEQDTAALGAAWQAQARQLAQRPLDTWLAQLLREASAVYARDESAVVATLAGSVVGFAAPAFASVLQILRQWAEGGQLADLAERWQAQRDRAWLRGAVIAALMNTPVPPLLYRTAVEPTVLEGVEIAPGTRVVVGLASAAIDGAHGAHGAQNQSWYWLFGGSRPEQPHACPARNAAVSAVAGIAAALLERRGLSLRGLTVTFSE